MRILFHHRIRSKDGQYVHIEELTQALENLGHEVIVVGPAAIEKEKFGADAGPVAVLKRVLPRFAYELLEFGYAFWAYARLSMAFRRHRPDCLYERYNLYLPAGVWFKRRFKLPMLLEVNAPLLQERKKYGGISLARLARWSESYTWYGADFVLPVTQILAGFIKQVGVPEEKIVVLPNGVNLERFEKALNQNDAKRRLGLEGRLVLGFTGFVREWHALERVVDLITGTRVEAPLHFLLVGDGPARAALEKLARQRGVENKMTVTGVIGRGEIADYIAAFDVALQPAVVGYASPLKLLEYMAAGCAIVAPAKPNIQEILSDGVNAVLFDPDDPGAFARAVERVCSDPVLRERIRRGARQALADKGLSWENNARTVAALFSRLKAKHVGSNPV